MRKRAVGVAVVAGTNRELGRRYRSGRIDNWAMGMKTV